MILYCATSNPGKLREFQMAASDVCAIETVPGLAEIEPPAETGKTFEANAVLKALHYGRHTDGYVFAEDSGLEVDALGGAPGVYSARYAGPDATDEQNNALVLERLGDTQERSARFVCTIALVHRNRHLSTFRGTVDGEILYEPRGANGFGYDPLFYYPPFGCSFGEVPREQKQTVSHRGAALRQLLDFVRTL